MEERVGIGRNSIDIEITGREGVEVEVIWGVNNRIEDLGLGVMGSLGGRRIGKI